MSKYDVENKIVIYEGRDYVSHESYLGGSNSIKPGFLCMMTSPGADLDLVQPQNTSGDHTEKLFAVENGYEGKEIDDDYEVGEKVFLRICQRGDIVLGWVESGEPTIERGTPMVSYGASFLGYLTTHATTPLETAGAIVGYAYERLPNIGANQRLAIRIA
jgi:hypothetical protein